MAGSGKLRMGAMLQSIEGIFAGAEDVPRREASLKHSLRDVLMAGLAMFVFKAPSLLRFEDWVRHGSIKVANLRRLFGLREVPSDETMRQRLDVLEPTFLERAFRILFALAQRAKMLRHFEVDGHYILAVDGTGIYSSPSISCETCCVRRRRSGDEHYHFMVQGALVHPRHRHVLMPSAPEFVRRSDGMAKNDGEQAALRRHLLRFRREHPHLNVVVALDGLHPNTPTVRLLKKLNLRFAIVAKRGNCERPFADFAAFRRGAFEDPDEEGRRLGRTVEYARRVRLTADRNAPRLTMVRTSEPSKPRRKGDPPRTSEWAFVSDLELPDEDAEANRARASRIAILGRARWKIENHVFKTLKESTGGNMKHNYGHGRRHLWMILTTLMLIAFQLDQLQALGSAPFQRALRQCKGRPSYLWDEMRARLNAVLLSDWDMLFSLIGDPDGWIVAPTPAGGDPPGS